VDARAAHRILQGRNVGRLMKAIRDVNHSEELTFEQILIADNPPSRDFLLIDRQVTDHHMHRRLDLLGLRRLESGRYGFVVIEVKRASPRARQRSSDSSSPLCRELAAATVDWSPPSPR
jgi:hypothetical protein